jgi:hypothetical protein
MARQSEKPPLSGCKGSLHTPKHGGWLSWHWWYYKDNWNDNSLPFSTSTHGVRRSGWRCLDCGEYVWDLSDKEFALSYAESIGAIKLPEPAPRLLSVFDQVNQHHDETGEQQGDHEEIAESFDADLAAGHSGQ